MRDALEHAAISAVLLSEGVAHVTIAGNLIHTAHAGSGVTFASTSTRPGSPPGSPNQAPVTYVVIRGNHFDRTLPCRGMTRYRCGHQDLVQLFAGRRLTVERNRFGVYRDGGPSST